MLCTTCQVGVLPSRLLGENCHLYYLVLSQIGYLDSIFFPSCTTFIFPEINISFVLSCAYTLVVPSFSGCSYIFAPDALKDWSQSWQHTFQMYSKCVWKQSVRSAHVLSIWVPCPTMPSSTLPGRAAPVVSLMSWVLMSCTSCGLDVLGPVLLGCPFTAPLSHASLLPRLLLHFSRAHPSSFLTKGTWEVHVLRSHMSKNVCLKKCLKMYLFQNICNEYRIPGWKSFFIWILDTLVCYLLVSDEALF